MLVKLRAREQYFHVEHATLFGAGVLAKGLTGVKGCPLGRQSLVAQLGMAPMAALCRALWRRSAEEERSDACKVLGSKLKLTRRWEAHEFARYRLAKQFKQILPAGVTNTFSNNVRRITLRRKGLRT